MIDTGFGTFFLSPSSLLHSPSSIHGIPPSTEQALRLYSCQIIQDSVILLRLPHAVTATAQVLFHRFFSKRSFRDFEATTIAAACVWLAVKLEEGGSSSRGEKRSRLRDVLNVFQRIAYRREGAVSDASDYKERETALLNAERQILVELGFVCHVDHPHKFLISYLKCLEASPELTQEAWNLNFEHHAKADAVLSRAMAQLLSSGLTAEFVNSYPKNHVGVGGGCLVSNSEGPLGGEKKKVCPKGVIQGDSEKNGELPWQVLLGDQHVNIRDPGPDEDESRKREREDSEDREIELKRHRQRLSFACLGGLHAAARCNRTWRDAPRFVSWEVH